MRRKTTIDLRHVAVYVITMVCLMVILPVLAIRLFPVILEHEDQGPVYEGEIPKTVKVWITEEEKYKTIPFEKYVQGVVASEMPASFGAEALKAQAVASRTYALGRINAGGKLCDTVHCQVYRSDNIPAKVKKAVNATKGQVLLYNGKLAAHALYFASSAGKTENSQDVFSGEYAYLVSVDSSYEPGATHKKESLTMTISKFASKIKKAMPELDFGKITKQNIKIKSRSEGGRAALIQIGDQKVSGADVRSAFKLYSTRIKFAFRGNKITITTSGSGHGVGMSQYGAKGLAKKGKSYTEILSHYYQGTDVSR
ncbi:stage II sporulation protein D [Ihubacter sp. rT4E-8]|uniref:stage II sporulation protein D n=1 Tax=Ihubacter sp. rT4E-8 TaxID=3242369 RepID=UPI00137952FE